MAFIGLNPSTADEHQDDHTIRRCMNLAGSWGAGGIVMLNLYAYRATHPESLWVAPDPIGDENDTYILRVCKEAQTAIACWGGFPQAERRIENVVRMLSGNGVSLSILGMTKDGYPRHPSRMPNGATPLPWAPSRN